MGALIDMTPFETLMEHAAFDSMTVGNFLMLLPVLAAMLFAVGIVHLIYGWRIYRITFTAFCLILAGMAGTYLEHWIDLPWYVLATPPIVLAVFLCIWIERVLVFVTIGGATLLVFLSKYELPIDTLFYIAAGLAFILGGTLAVLLWRPFMILYQALIGALCILAGLFVAALGVRGLDARLLLNISPIWCLLTAAVIAIPGAVYQMVLLRRAEAEAETEKPAKE